MPNHIQNKIHFIGDKKEIEKVINAIRTQEGDELIPIDFNKIKPMPKELDIVDSSLGSLAQTLLFGTGGDDFLGISEMQKRMRGFAEERRIEAVELALKYQSNTDKYGHRTWYNWARENWGTKWNAYGHPDSRNTEDTIYFQTAWSSPVELIRLLSSQFPEVLIELNYADEDSGSNTGQYKFKAGETVASNIPASQSIEAYDMYFDLHPGRKDDYNLVDGRYEYTSRD